MVSKDDRICCTLSKGNASAEPFILTIEIEDRFVFMTLGNFGVKTGLPLFRRKHHSLSLLRKILSILTVPVLVMLLPVAQTAGRTHTTVFIIFFLYMRLSLYIAYRNGSFGPYD